MSLRYRISDEVAWLDAAAGGRDESVAWIARLSDGELFQLEDAAWLVWVLIGDGVDTAAGIRASFDELEVAVDFGEHGLEDFLAGLVSAGMLVAEPAAA